VYRTPQIDLDLIHSMWIRFRWRSGTIKKKYSGEKLVLCRILSRAGSAQFGLIFDPADKCFFDGEVIRLYGTPQIKNI
jgi:hypothetical protein